ncbi:MAG: methylmalonyl-CoA epimerase [Ignavibacteriales bacterium]|nr:methylmalonyl-CoA epimerase [Ignavibacteriales bacterium]
MKLSHVGVAVKNLDDAVKLYSKLFRLNHIPIEEVADQKVRVAFCHVGNASVELTEATAPDSPIAKFIEKRGEGIHHLSFEVDDIESELARLKSEGFQLIDVQPRVGAGGYLIAFIHPKSANGVLIELSQKQK